MVDLPSKELLAEITRAATDAGCADIPQAVAYGIEGFTGGAFAEIGQVDSFFALARLKQPKLWAQADPALDAEYSEIMVDAFEKKSPDARARLLKTLGPEAADAAARAWNLTGINDCRSAPTRPTAGNVEAKRKDSTNPFAPNFKGADKTAAIADWIKKFGTQSASRMASVHGVDIAGRPLARRA